MITNLSPGKEPWLAVILSKIFSGIGHIYAGEVLKGWILIAIGILLNIATFWFCYSPQGNTLIAIGLLIGLLIFVIWSWVDAHKSAKKMNNPDFEELRLRNKDPWLAAFISSFIPGIGHVYLRKWIFVTIFIALWIIGLFYSRSNLLMVLALWVYHFFVVYHAYISAPSHRESSRKLILVVCGFLLLSTTFLGAALIASRIFLVEPRYTPSSSMEPTLQINDRLLVDKISYHFRNPAQSEMIVFQTPSHPSVAAANNISLKRLIGLPGDRIAILNGKVLVNGQAINEPYIAEPVVYNLPTNDPNACPNCFQPQEIAKVNDISSFTVPPNHYWVMGDNRNNSLDSHIWGFLPAEYIVGRVYVRYWPVDNRVRDLTIPSDRP
jgi:signal peptidase I